MNQTALPIEAPIAKRASLYDFPEAELALQQVGYRHPQVLVFEEPLAVAAISEALVAGLPNRKRADWQVDHLLILFSRLLRAGDFVEMSLAEAVADLIDRRLLSPHEVMAIATAYRAIGRVRFADALATAVRELEAAS